MIVRPVGFCSAVLVSAIVAVVLFAGVVVGAVGVVGVVGVGVGVGVTPPVIVYELDVTVLPSTVAAIVYVPAVFGLEIQASLEISTVTSLVELKLSGVVKYRTLP